MKVLKKLIDSMGLMLDDSETIELEKIEEAIRLVHFAVPAFFQDIYMYFRGATHIRHLEARRVKSVDIYRFRREAKDALESAMASDGNQVMWNKAYKLARNTDNAERSLLNIRLDALVSQIRELIIGLKLAQLVGTIWFGSRYFNPSSGYFVLVVQLIELFSISFKIYQFDVSSTIENVLNAARDAGVELNTTVGEMLEDSDSLICQLINIRNNTKILEEIKSLQVPDEFCCAITYETMTDPVYSEQNPTRFERASILEWLEKRKVHPCTELPLTSDDLKRDFQLKRSIDQYVDNKSREHANQQTKNPLTQLSVFQPKLECYNDDEISDQMMAESAFDKGANTYKNKHC